jgi:hypothetical protein
MGFHRRRLYLVTKAIIDSSELLDEDSLSSLIMRSLSSNKYCVSHIRLVSFIWFSADDCLRDVYVRGKCLDWMLPHVPIESPLEFE